MKKYILVIVATLFLSTGIAYASNNQWFEKFTVGHAIVDKFIDKDNDVICYIAQSRYNSASVGLDIATDAVSIFCLK